MFTSVASSLSRRLLQQQRQKLFGTTSPIAAAAGSKRHVSNKLFLSTIPPSTTKESLTSFFSSYGNIHEVRVIPSRKEGRRFAFIEFEDTKSALAAMEEMEFRRFEGRHIYPIFHVEKGGVVQRGSSSGDSGSYRKGREGAGRGSYPSYPQRHQQEHHHHSQYPTQQQQQAQEPVQQQQHHHQHKQHLQQEQPQHLRHEDVQQQSRQGLKPQFQAQVGEKEQLQQQQEDNPKEEANTGAAAAAAAPQPGEGVGGTTIGQGPNEGHDTEASVTSSTATLDTPSSPLVTSEGAPLADTTKTKGQKQQKKKKKTREKQKQYWMNRKKLIQETKVNKKAKSNASNGEGDAATMEAAAPGGGPEGSEGVIDQIQTQSPPHHHHQQQQQLA